MNNIIANATKMIAYNKVNQLWVSCNKIFVSMSFSRSK